MAQLSTLSKAQAFNPGSNLWVTTLDPTSKWLPEFDWHLNFMVSGFFHRKQTPRASELIEICEGCEFEYQNLRPQLDSLKTPLLINSSQFFPNKWTLFLPEEDFNNPQAFFKNHWEKLEKPHTRFFLSPNTNAQDFNLAISALDSVIEFSAVIA